MLAYHIRRLEDRALAKQVYAEQLARGWPGLAKECKEICERLKVEDVNETVMSKNQFKKHVEKACQVEDEAMMKRKMESLSKMSDRIAEDCKMKEYMKNNLVSVVRDIFRIRTNMNQLRGNFKNDYKLTKQGSRCNCGLEEENNKHIMECSLYYDIRVGKDMSCDKELVEFFRAVMDRRRKKDEK